jgi:hypothetical protein
MESTELCGVRLLVWIYIRALCNVKREGIDQLFSPMMAGNISGRPELSGPIVIRTAKGQGVGDAKKGA